MILFQEIVLLASALRRWEILLGLFEVLLSELPLAMFQLPISSIVGLRDYSSRRRNSDLSRSLF